MVNYSDSFWLKFFNQPGLSNGDKNTGQTRRSLCANVVVFDTYILCKTSLLLFLWIVGAIDALGQADLTLIDPRDGSVYPVTEINGTTWMLENLNYVTNYSEELNVKSDTIASGRYYDLIELDSVCPHNWRLPTMQEWVAYYHYVDELNPDWSFTYEDKLKREHLFRITNYENFYDPLAPDNLLNIKNTSWFQGGTFFTDVGLQPLATYWISDIVPGKLNRSHIHITPSFIHIHSHKHNLNPKQAQDVRKFMVRCIKCKPDEK